MHVVKDTEKKTLLLNYNAGVSVYILRICGCRVCHTGIYWVHVVSCLVSPEVVPGRCAVGKCV